MAEKVITLIGMVKKVVTFLAKLLAKEVTTLYIDDTSLKLLVAEGNKVTKCVTLPLESGLVKGGVVVDRKKVAAKIKELLEAPGIRSREVVVALSGLHCLFRFITLPKLSGAMLVEAIRWEANRVMPVPLEEFYIQWQVVPVYREETQVFLVALPRNATDALIETLREADVKTTLMDLAPLALARMASRATSVIVDVRSTEVDIVIMVEGIPHLIHSLSLPSDAPSLQEKLPKIREEIRHTIKFYDSGHPEKPLEPGLPILVSGELGEEPEACQSLSDELNYPVLPLAPILKCQKDLAPSQYMVNIGLALKKLSVGGRASFSLVNLNALPEVYRPLPLSLTRISIPVGSAVAVALLVYLVMIAQTTTAETASLQEQVDGSYRLLEIRQEKQKLYKEELAELQKQVDELEATRDAFTGVLSDFSRHQEKVNSDIRTANDLTSNVNLESITHTSDTLTITGICPDMRAVLTYVKDLKTSGRFSLVLITTMTKTETDVSFILTLIPREID